MKKPTAPGAIRLTLRPSRRTIARVGGGVHLLVGAEPPASRERTERPPVALALVIDRSGSMGGPATAPGTPASTRPGLSAHDTGVADKLSFVRAATLRLLDLMRDGDAVSLITFDDVTTVVKPLTVLNARSRQALAAAVGRLAPGGSTNLEGGLRAGLQQLGGAARERYSCRLVLLSDGEANIGEQRPAVLGEVAAAAARDGVTTSTLGVGFDYNIRMMSTLAEAGNGDFSHIHTLEALDDILREEFTNAAEVTARAVELNVHLPEKVAAGTNLNGYRQTHDEQGFTVHVGDLVRAKDILFELTTPVPLDGDTLTVAVTATHRDASDVPHRAEATCHIEIGQLDEANAAPVDDQVMARLLALLPARAEMATVLAYEAGDFDQAGAAVQAGRQALDQVRLRYGSAATGRPEMSAWQARLNRLGEGASARSFASSDLKGMYASSHDLTRARPARSTPPSDLTF